MVIGNGSFGVVYQAKLCDTGEMVAIKKVLQDKRFKVSSTILYLSVKYELAFVSLFLKYLIFLRTSSVLPIKCSVFTLIIQYYISIIIKEKCVGTNCLISCN